MFSGAWLNSVCLQIFSDLLYMDAFVPLCNIISPTFAVITTYDITEINFLNQATVSVKIRNFLICYCNFDLSGHILEKENVIENLNVVLSYYVEFFSNLICFDLEID